MGHHRGTEDTKRAEAARSSNDLSGRVIGAAIAVHRVLGPGLLESVYLACLSRELELRAIRFERQVAIPVEYAGVRLPVSCRLDLFVERALVVELKAVDALLPVHHAQVLTYLRLTGVRLGLLINFNTPVLTRGIKRLVND